MYRFLLFCFLIISCKKETSVEGISKTAANSLPTTSNNQPQLITAEFLDGQKLKEFTYNNVGQLIGARNYQHPKSTEEEWIMERIYNDKELAIRDNYILSGRTFIYEYRTYSYDKDKCIADSLYYRSLSNYFLRECWNIKNVEYDAQNRIKKTYTDNYGEKYISEFLYDYNGNIIKELNSFSRNTWFPFTNQYEFSNEKAFQHPLSNNIDNNIYTYNRWSHKTDKNFCTKFINNSITVKFTILEKNIQGNPTKIQWLFNWPDGSTQTDIYTYTYK